MKQWQTSAPTNIALIKYMGKKDSESNLPTNASLSYTLDHLRSTVILTQSSESADRWDSVCQFNHDEKNRFIKHLVFLKKQFNFNGNFIVYSENNFPAGCGLASSASSFAALTLCALAAFDQKTLDMQQIARLSRHGSGSSCRSFFSPWALWEDDRVIAPQFPYPHLQHKVVVVSREKKMISSSKAHQIVETSSLFIDRPKRAEQRLQNLITAFERLDWSEVYQIVWQEFWDMHALFETAAQPFGYLKPESIAVLDYIREYWRRFHDGPVVTMDAGPNIHLLFREDQGHQLTEITKTLSEKFFIL